MEHILPNGSIIEVKGGRLCVLGARLVEKDGKLVLGYMVTRHPRGLAGMDSLGMLLAEKIEHVVFHGNEGVNGKRYREGMEQFYGPLIGRDAKEAEALLQWDHRKQALSQHTQQREDFMGDIGG